MHSVDKNEKYYRDGVRNTGFMCQGVKENLCVHGEHHFYLGKIIPECIDEIGNEIDLVVLGTVHFMPGEVLDFLAMLPYMKNSAVICLHDLAYHYYSDRNGK